MSNMTINVIKLGQWPKETSKGQPAPGQPGIAIIEDSTREAERLGRLLAGELREKHVVGANIFVILDLPGNDFQLAREILRDKCDGVCMVLVDMADDDAVEFAKRTGQPIESQNRSMFPGIGVAEELLAREEHPVVVGLSGFSVETLSEYGPLPFDCIYKPTFKAFVSPYIDALIEEGTFKCR